MKRLAGNTIRRTPSLLTGLITSLVLITGSETASHFFMADTLRNADHNIHPNTVNLTLLEDAIVTYTNMERRKYRLNDCTFNTKLQTAARRHSEEMVRLKYFSHHSPVAHNKTLKKRLILAGVDIQPEPGSSVEYGENIAADYFLKISKVPYYVETVDGVARYFNARNNRPIPFQTYREFARQMVANWMSSPGHRKNILNKHFNHIGIGARIGALNGMKAIYVTQNFMGIYTSDS